jgi:hypothetical protein
MGDSSFTSTCVCEVSRLFCRFQLGVKEEVGLPKFRISCPQLGECEAAAMSKEKVPSDFARSPQGGTPPRVACLHQDG